MNAGSRPLARTLGENAAHYVMPRVFWLASAVSGLAGFFTGWAGWGIAITVLALALAPILMSYINDRALWDWLGGNTDPPELDDRADALRNAVGLKHRALVFIGRPDEKRRTPANVSGMRYPVVVIADSFHTELEGREWDNVVAHELGHVLDRDRLRRPLLRFGAGTAVGAAITLGRHVTPGLYSLAVLAVLALLAGHRQIERGADRAAARAVGDTDAFWRALVKAQNWLDMRRPIPTFPSQLPAFLLQHPTPKHRREAYARATAAQQARLDPQAAESATDETHDDGRPVGDAETGEYSG